MTVSMTSSREEVTAPTLHVEGANDDDANAQEDDEKPRTLFVGNVPREVHKREIEEVFGDIGPLKRCHIQYPRDGNEKRKRKEECTVAYVTFALSQDAVKALETLQNTKIGNNRINLKFVKNRSEQNRPGYRDRGPGGDRRFERSANFEPLPPKEKPPRVKTEKKKARLIVRNLPWKVTDVNMREHFQQFGDVKDVNILKKPNGKLVGCGFIQYGTVFQAAKALKELNLKPFLGRPIAIDWALPKQTYQTEDEKNKAKTNEVSDVVEIKEEPESEVEENKFDASDHYAHLKEEPMDTDDIKEEIIEKKSSGSKRKIEESDEETDSDENDDDDDDDSEEEDDDHRKSFSPSSKRLSNDVEEGKTLFLRNLAFDTTEEEMKQFFEQFGELHYALLCKDPLTEHPKGTGFVKFKNKTSADKCLNKYGEDSSEFKLKRRQFMVSVALPKGKLDIKPSEETKKKPTSDSRNLYLVREGFIRPGSGAEVDVSPADMSKRARLNQVKKQMLKNLNIFISPTRLCVHNLPQSLTDKQLRKLFMKHAGPGAKIKEAKIMRDMKNIDLNGIGKSKEYGFVNFVDHDHALTALRTVNNNPSIFSSHHRPIVEFSLENRAALKAKEKRAQKSKEKNLSLSEKNNKRKKMNDERNEHDGVKTEKQGRKKKKNTKKPPEASGEDITEKDDDKSVPAYAGLVAKKGVQTVPSFKPKGKITRNSLKTKRTKKKKLQERKQREPQVPSKRPVGRADKTEKLISKHKKSLNAPYKNVDAKKKKKWFE